MSTTSGRRTSARRAPAFPEDDERTGPAPAEWGRARRASVNETIGMATQLDVELSALRSRRRSSGLMDRLRTFAPFDRRAIRDPESRDLYWANVQRRLAESDHESLTRHRSTERPPVTIG